MRLPWQKQSSNGAGSTTEATTRSELRQARDAYLRARDNYIRAKVATGQFRPVVASDFRLTTARIEQIVKAG